MSMENLQALIQQVQAEKSLTKAIELIYIKYSNSTQDTTKIPLDLGKNDDTIVFDKGWFYNNNGERFFKRTGKYLLKKGTEYVTVNPEEFIKDYKNSDSLKFTSVSIQIKKIERTSSWIWLNGNKYLGFNNRLRFYFSFEKNDTNKIIEFVSELGKILDAKKTPYKIKIEESLTNRNENAVLYFNKSHYYVVFIIVHFMYNKYRHDDIFKEGNFLFVKTFENYKGLAFAEDPNGVNSSFGEMMATLFAQAILYGGVSNEIELKKYVEYQGYDYDRLYLNPNTNFEYLFNIFENDYIEGLIHVEDKLGDDENLVTIQKIAMIIINNAIIYQNQENIKCDWLKTVIDPIWKEEIDCFLCNDEEKLEILEFLSTYLALFNSDNNSDKIVLEISRIAFQSINVMNLTEGSKEKLRTVNQLLYRGHGGSITTPELLFRQLQNSDSASVQHAIKAIKYNLDQRGIVSYLPDDEFNPTQKDYGYAYLGLVLLNRWKNTQPN